MKRLRLLQFANVQLVGDFKYLSTDLRWLCWHEFPSEYTNANFDQGNLVAIDFKYSKLELVWKKSQMMKQLKILNLSHSQHLTQTPDFSNLPNLEKLILKYCPKLTSVSHTIEHLKQVLLINLKGCSGLRVLPKSIYRLKSLKTLILSGCSLIDKLEEGIEQMESLATLMADKTAITQVPHALLRLKSIVYISLCDFEGLSRNVFLQSFVPNRNSQGLSSIIRGLPQVQNVRLECGSQLQITGNVASDTFDVTNCNEIMKFNATLPGDSLLPGNKNPDWLTFSGEGPFVIFDVPNVNGRKLKSMLLCIVYSSSSNIVSSEEGPIIKNLCIINHTKTTPFLYDGDTLSSLSDEEWQKVISNFEAGDKVQIVAASGLGFTAKKTAVYLIYAAENMNVHDGGEKHLGEFDAAFETKL
ncbi:hypothetical protein PIB30_092135 [Stylosanthes scabra]|uniref:Uncharacterized protein n=1 Tax=Stylosanthes scabra TaxID=79078 RepID=A0ABU6VYH3_9FABA|nr:hypothetical protein [Stylosanthes scabra]